MLPEAQSWLDDYQNAKAKSDSSAFYFNIGFLTAPDKDPIVEGKAAYQSFLDNNQTSTLEKINDISLKSLSVIRCAENCPNQWLTDDLSKVKNSKLLLKRYNQFLNLDDYRNMHMDEKYYVKALLSVDILKAYKINKLYLANTIQALAGNGVKKLVIDGLIKNTKRQVEILDKINTLLDKMIQINIVSENIDTLSWLYVNDKFSKDLPVVEIKDANINNFSEIMKSEFVFGYTSIMNPNFAEEISSVETKHSFIERLFNKYSSLKNKTINKYFYKYKQIADYANQPTNQLANYKFVDIAPTLVDVITNFRGVSSLSYLSNDRFVSYVQHIANINLKIKLYNILQSKLPVYWKTKTEFIAKDFNIDVSNPYYPQLTPFIKQLDDGSRKLCYKTLDDDKLREIACVYSKI